MRPRSATSLLLLALFVPPAVAPVAFGREPLKVVATHSALGDIARQIGGDRVAVRWITPPTWDIHTMEAKPSVFAMLADADVFLHSGLDLELWARPAVKGARNPRIEWGQPGNVDCSEGIALLQVPTNPSRAEGDIHIYGNPHYWMDPVNAIQISKTIAAGLARVDPEGADDYAARRRTFEKDLKRRLIGWLKRTIPHKNTPIVVYHDSFPYFARRFGFRVVATLEPKPRIPPTQRHLLSVLDTIRREGVKVVVREPFHDEEATRFVAERTNVRIVTLGTMPGFAEGTDSYQDMIEEDIDRLLDAVRS